MTRKRAGRPPRDPELKAVLADLAPRILRDAPDGMTAGQLHAAATATLGREFKVGAVVAAIQPQLEAGRIKRRKMPRAAQPSKAPLIYTMAAAPDRANDAEDAERARDARHAAFVDQCIEEQKRGRLTKDTASALFRRISEGAQA